jgi:ethanolamine utilization protein EutA (predicted chaperonin)
METVLTLNIDKDVVKSAEDYANYTNKTVSQLVEEYLLSISRKNEIDGNKQLGPITRQLAGIIKMDNDINHKEILTDALMEKYL